MYFNDCFIKHDLYSEKIGKTNNTLHSHVGPSGVKFMTLKDIYNVIKSCNEQTFDKKIDFMQKSVLNMNCDDAERLQDLKEKLSMIRYEFKARWQAAHRIKAVFEKKNSNWLNRSTTIPFTSEYFQ